MGLPANARCSTSSISCPCLRNVSRQERMTQKLSAPSTVLKQPETFCSTLGMHTARSATLLVKGTSRSRMNNRTASACLRKRRRGLQATEAWRVRPSSWEVRPRDSVLLLVDDSVIKRRECSDVGFAEAFSGLSSGPTSLIGAEQEIRHRLGPLMPRKLLHVQQFSHELG